jgi:NADH-quinone oxidoreductase subunit E
MSAVESTSPQFSSERLENIKVLAARYPHQRSALLPVLHMAQEDFGYLSMDVQKLVAETLGVHLMAVREVVTFYTMFREKPCGTYMLEVCTNAGCMLNGADDLVRHICQELNIKVGQTTPDGMFTVAEVECAGACAGAPVVQINNAYHEKVDAAHMDAFIATARGNSNSEGGEA